MEGLVNYSSEDEQDNHSYTKVAVRERVSGGTSSGRSGVDASGHTKRHYEHSTGGSCEREISPYRKGRDAAYECYKSGNTNYEDKYKTDRRTDKPIHHRDKRDSRESKFSRDMRDDSRDYDNDHKYDYKKHDDHKRHRDSKRDDSEYFRDEKRYRYDGRKPNYAPNYKDRFNTSKSRYDDRKQNERFNEERRGGGGSNGFGGGDGSSFTERRKDFTDRRSYNNDDERKTDRRNNDDRRIRRSYNEDRANAYRPRRSSSPTSTQRKNCNKYNEHKDDISSKRERKRHSRSRSRSRSQSVDNTIQRNLAKNNSHHKTETKELLLEMKQPDRESPSSEKKSLPSARNFEVLLNLPLSDNASKNPNVTVPACSAAVGSNPATATVQLPSYYNLNIINPNKYVEQMQKRKLIWGAKKSEDSASKWGHAQFSQDQDGKVASKFMRLMGIKNATGTASESSTLPNDNEKKSVTSTTPPNKDVKSREAMFSSMEQQYEVARQVTHTMRGVGLGFSSARPY